MYLSRNLKFIIKQLSKLIVLEFCLFCAVVYFFQPHFIQSSLLGIVFSFFVILDFAVSEYSILHGRRRGVFFLFYLSRLFLYAIPLILALFFKNYFNFFVTLIFLFTYQIHFIAFEFFRSLKKVKRQKING